ncbi:uncharacterized protein [Spinacia oleracea]|uniref:Uncharacterized protein n=1 Tax=Spinacia oleracea TaxID=3562 RepID=A0ABM3QTS8_SPIOL|nr:uncharacterized protein LOC130462487 [Spinacia oleracea]
MGPADVVTKPSVPKPSAPPAEGEVPPIQTPIPPPAKKEVPSQVDAEMDGTAGAAADEAAVDQTAAADTTALSREDKGKGKETEAPSTDNASTPPAASSIVEMFKRMRRAEVASIPPSAGFSSEAKIKSLPMCMRPSLRST